MAKKGVPNIEYLADELVSHKTFINTEFYNEFGRKYGAVHFLGGLYHVNETTHMLIGIDRSDQFAPFGEQDRRDLKLVVGHLVRAMNVAQTLHGAEHQLVTATMALDALATGVVLLDRKGRVTFANQEARCLVGRGDGIRMRHRGLTATEPREDAMLQRAIHTALSAKPEAGPPGTLRLSMRDGITLTIVVAPLRGEPIAQAANAGVIVFLHDPKGAPRGMAQVLANLHGLTPAETRLLDALLAGEALGDYAEHRRLSRNTVKTQMAKLLAKTGANRQTDLMRIALSNPLLARAPATDTNSHGSVPMSPIAHSD